jgi:chromosome segregation ATPase
MGVIGIMRIMGASADLPDPKGYVGLGWVLVAIGALMVIANQAIKLKRNLSGEPPNQVLGVSAQEMARRMQMAEQKIDESDKRRKSLYDRIESSGNHTRTMIDALKEQLKAGIDSLRRDVKEDVDALHDKINAVAAAQGGHETAVEMLNQRLAQMDSKMEQRFAHLDEKLDRRMPA